MPTPKFFYFDLGNVLLHFDHARSARQAAELAGCSFDVAWDVIFGRHDLEAAYESGRIDGAEFHRQYCELTGTSPQAEPFLEAVSAIFWPVVGMIPLVAHLHAAGYPLGILSNTCDAHWNYCLRKFPFLTWYFPVACLSYEVGGMKPEPEIYQAACRFAGEAPGDVFFVDDRPDNVAGARIAGIDAVPFLSPQELTRDLAHRGVRTNF